MRRNFLEATVAHLLEAIGATLRADERSRRAGLLQSLDPRAKVAGFAALILAIAAARRLEILGALLCLSLVAAAVAKVGASRLAALFTAVGGFTGVIALPALFLTPGEAVAQVPPFDWSVTRQGLTAAAYLLGRAAATSTLLLVLVSTTPWNHLLRALRVFGVPVVAVALISMTYRYIFLMLETAHEMFQARRSRVVGQLPAAMARRMVVSSAGVLLSRTFQLSGEVYLAMQARGYRGEVFLLERFAMRPRDWAALAMLGAASAAAIWTGR